ncbi:MAG: hypothetical protein KDA42_15230 [Planctomycetales bacterium]|nr:hypothetical protein [Planctomycetales bacterium]
MIRPRISLPLLLAAVAVLPSGCASIMCGRHSQVRIDSHPQQADVSIRNLKGDEVASGRTPMVVELKRNRSWLRPAHYTATLAKPGYESTDVPIRGRVNPWILGNVVFGGLGGLAVDGATGAGWKPTPADPCPELRPLPSATPNKSMLSQQHDGDENPVVPASAEIAESL